VESLGRWTENRDHGIPWQSSGLGLHTLIADGPGLIPSQGTMTWKATQTNKKPQENKRSKEKMQRRNGVDLGRQNSASRRTCNSPAHQAPGFEGLAGRTGRPAPTLGSWCCRQPGGMQDSVKGTWPSTSSVSPENPCPYGQPKGNTSSQE